MGRGLEEGRLPRHLAPELAAGGEVHIPQHNPRLRRLVFINDEASLPEHHGLGPVSGDVSVELLAIPVPLDTVEAVPLQIVEALQSDVLASDRIAWDGLLSDPDGSYSCYCKQAQDSFHLELLI